MSSSEILQRSEIALTKNTQGPVCVLSRRKPKIPETNSVGPQASIDKATDNSKNDARNVCDPVVHVDAAVKGRLKEFNEIPKGTRPHKYRGQSKAPGSGQREGECRKGNEVYDLVAAVGRWRRGLQRPKHRDCQSEGNDEGDRNVEVLAHQLKLMLTIIKGNKSSWKTRIIVKMESGCLSGFCGFR